MSKPELLNAATEWNMLVQIARGRGVVLGKGDKAQYRARAFKAQRDEQHPLDQLDHALERVHVQSLLDQQTPVEAHALSRGEHQPHADRADAQAAYLYQRREHHLTEDGEVVKGVDGNQARDAHRAGGREQRVDVVDLDAGAHGNGEYQQNGADQYDRCEAHGYQPPAADA